MKALRLLAIAALLIGLVACETKKTETFSGRIKRTTENSVTIVAKNGRLITFTTENADLKHAYGMLEGNTATAEYEGKLEPTMPALKISTDPTYARAIGRWVESEPANPSAVKGFYIELKGVARSINMPERHYKSWEVGAEPNQIILRGTLKENGKSTPFEETATIVTENGKLTLSINNELWIRQNRR